MLNFCVDLPYGSPSPGKGSFVDMNQILDAYAERTGQTDHGFNGCGVDIIGSMFQLLQRGQFDAGFKGELFLRKTGIFASFSQSHLKFLRFSSFSAIESTDGVGQRAHRGRPPQQLEGQFSKFPLLFPMSKAIMKGQEEGLSPLPWRFT